MDKNKLRNKNFLTQSHSSSEPDKGLETQFSQLIRPLDKPQW